MVDIKNFIDVTVRILKIQIDLYGITFSFWNLLWYVVIAGFVIWILREMF